MQHERDRLSQGRQNPNRVEFWAFAPAIRLADQRSPRSQYDITFVSLNVGPASTPATRWVWQVTEQEVRMGEKKILGQNFGVTPL